MPDAKEVSGLTAETVSPKIVSVFKTAVFKIHDLSKRKRAMMRDSMKRAHVSYDNQWYPDTC